VNYKSIPYKEPRNPIGTVAELFAGVGGFRIGLARAGWKTVFSNQWEPSTKAQHASDVYTARFGAEGHSNEDISKVKTIPAEFDLLVGGFPCQDYSVAKSATSATGLEGKKGVLWWEILRLVTEHEPKYIFLENVDRLLKSPTSQRGRDFAVMLTTLGNAGYVVEWRVVNAAEYGFPQRRIRVFIVATRKSFVPANLSAADYIFSTGVLPRALAVTGDEAGVSRITIDSDPAMVSRTFNPGTKRTPFGNAGVFLDGAAHTATVTSKSRKSPVILRDILVDDSEVPEEFWVDSSRLGEWEFLKGAKSLDRIHKESGFAYKYAEGAMAFPDSAEKPSRTILTGEGGPSPSRFKHLIQTNRGHRRLLPIELERLCGFPDSWTDALVDPAVTNSRRAFFMGNSLVVGLIERVGQVLALDNASN
jgi:DNA (cytosine-5)-methyltransferase 1